jgi:hypothetical protein
MQRHRKARSTTVAADRSEIEHLLRTAATQVNAIDREIGTGRHSGQGIRDELARLIKEIQELFSGQPIKIKCDREQSPAAWVDSILVAAALRSCGVVERYLIGATLQQRHPDIVIPNHPSHAGDVQTGRSGDFPLQDISYHVTATDGKEAVERCRQNIGAGVHPVLLLPKRYVDKAGVYAEIAGIQNRLSILAIEDFMAQNIIEMSTQQQRDFFSTLKAIVEEYNRRLEKVETDLSLKIDLS